jgi:capsular polysaccharide biosynthesis protein
LQIASRVGPLYLVWRDEAVNAAASAFTVMRSDPWFSGLDCRTHFHLRGDAPAFRSRLEELLAGISVRAGQPETLLEVDAAFLLPGTLCLYDKHGVRIDSSCIRRGPGMSEYYKAGPEAVAVPKACAIIRKPLLYLSWAQSHWGHFLTEGVSRLWARCAYAEMRQIRCLSLLPYPGSASVAGYLAALGLAGEQVRDFKVPVRIDKCFVPAASFSNRAEAYAAHLRPSREVVAAADRDAAQPVQRAVYMSRARLGADRLIRRELELELALCSLGVRIVYPEQLSLAEQIQLFNAHRVFIGCWGSAFHGLCLARDPEKITTHIIVDAVPNANYLMFDALFGCRSNYIQAMYPTPGAPGDRPGSDLTLDVEAFLAYLREAGCT